jgi:hypothetical protein
MLEGKLKTVCVAARRFYFLREEDVNCTTYPVLFISTLLFKSHGAPLANVSTESSQSSHVGLRRPILCLPRPTQGLLDLDASVDRSGGFNPNKYLAVATSQAVGGSRVHFLELR